MERIAKKYQLADEALGLDALRTRESGEMNTRYLGPTVLLDEKLRQPEKIFSLPWLLQLSAELGPTFEAQVLHPLHFAIYPAAAQAELPRFNLKSAKRSEEKTILEYEKDFRCLKDTLRGSIICADLDEVMTAWDRLVQLEQDGVLKVLQVKNRYRQKPLPGGYRDININVLYKGLICEVQLHTQPHYALKTQLHPTYALCRTLGLVGDLDGIDETRADSFWSPAARQKPTGASRSVRVLLFCVRFFVSFGMASVGGAYSRYIAVDDTYGFFGVTGWLLTWTVVSFSVPCFVVSSAYVMEMWDQNFRAMMAGYLTLFLALVGYHLAAPGVTQLPQTVWYTQITWLFVAAALFRRWYYRDCDHPPRRVALLYARYFGVDGEHYALKIAILQCVSTALQAFSKLGQLAMVVGDWMSTCAYWGLLLTLFLNAVLPPALLSSESPWMRREGTMVVDLLCDMVYMVIFPWFMFGHQQTTEYIVPFGILGFASTVYPSLRVLSVTRFLQNGSSSALAKASSSVAPSAAKGGVGTADGSSNCQQSRLSRKEAVWFALMPLVILSGVVVSMQDAYPWNLDGCRPCECSPEGVLQRCLFSGTELMLIHRSITGIEVGALDRETLPNLTKIRLTFNFISELPAQVFSAIPDLTWMDLSRNGLEYCEAGAFQNLTKVEEVWLNNNWIVSAENLGGIVDDMPALDMLHLGPGNTVLCEELHAWPWQYNGSCMDNF
jgi:hypothetical protein